MPMKDRKGSSTYMRSAKNSGRKIRTTRAKHRQSVSSYSTALSIAANFLSPDRHYGSAEFQLAWDNEVAFHVAENLIRLRRVRGMKQAEVAKRARTSQSAVARIESGEANVTIETLQRLIEALRGRCRLSIEPAEMRSPRFPAWWDDGVSFRGVQWHADEKGTMMVAGWESTAEEPICLQGAPLQSSDTAAAAQGV
ncbi:MAG: helix-turn-helix domain-containing protein [Terriglobales bacterium]